MLTHQNVNEIAERLQHRVRSSQELDEPGGANDPERGDFLRGRNVPKEAEIPRLHHQRQIPASISRLTLRLPLRDLSRR